MDASNTVLLYRQHAGATEPFIDIVQGADPNTIVVVDTKKLSLWELCGGNFTVLQIYEFDEEIHIQKVEFVKKHSVHIVLYDNNSYLEYGVMGSDFQFQGLGKINSNESTFLACCFSLSRQELIVSHSNGGVFVFAFRVLASGTFRCPLRCKFVRKKRDPYVALAIDEQNHRLFAGTTASVHIFDVVSGLRLTLISGIFPQAIHKMAYLATNQLLVQSESDSRLMVIDVLGKQSSIQFLVQTGQSPVTATYTKRIGSASDTRHIIFTISTSCQLTIHEIGRDKVDSALVTFLLPEIGVDDVKCSRLLWLLDKYLVVALDAKIFVVETLVDRIRPISSGLVSDLKRVKLQQTKQRCQLGRILHSASSEQFLCHSKMPLQLRLLEGWDNYKELSSFSLIQKQRLWADKSIQITCFDYSVELNACLVGWSNGDIDTYDPQGNHIRRLREANAEAEILSMLTMTMPFEASNATILISARSNGSFDTWILTPYNQTRLLSNTVHDQRSVISLLKPLACDMSQLIITVSDGGAIEVWEVDQNPQDGRILWKMRGCCVSSSMGVSTATLLDSRNICLGFQSGHIEVWQVPYGGRKHVRRCLVSEQYHTGILTQITAALRRPSKDSFVLASCAEDSTIVIWFLEQTLLPFKKIFCSMNVSSLIFKYPADADCEIHLYAAIGFSFQLIENISIAYRSVYYQLHKELISTPELSPAYAARQVSERQIPPEIPFIDRKIEREYHRNERLGMTINVTLPKSIGENNTTTAIVSTEHHREQNDEKKPRQLISMENFPDSDEINDLGIATSNHFSSVMDYLFDQAPVMPLDPIAQTNKTIQRFKYDSKPEHPIKQKDLSIVTIQAFNKWEHSDTHFQHRPRLKETQTGTIRPSTVSGVVTIVPMGEMLRLTCRPESSRRQGSDPVMEKSNSNTESNYDEFLQEMTKVPSTPDDLLLAEVQASVRCNVVRKLAVEHGIELPDIRRKDFIGSNAWLNYLQWYRCQPSVRILFQKEELVFASTHAGVLEDAKKSGLIVPEALDCSPSSQDWCRFVFWYNHGVVIPEQVDVKTIGKYQDESSAKRRAQFREEFLRDRIDTVLHVEKIYERVRREEISRQISVANAATKILAGVKKKPARQLKRKTTPDSLEKSTIDIFSEIVLPEGCHSEILPWSHINDEEKLNEVRLALEDVTVVEAAMRAGLNFDESRSRYETLDDFHDFIHWWTNPRIVYRHQFLLNEAERASSDKLVHDEAVKVGITMSFSDVAVKLYQDTLDESNPLPDSSDREVLMEGYHSWYFGENKTRIQFMKRRMNERHQQKRLHRLNNISLFPQQLFVSLLPHPIVPADQTIKKLNYIGNTGSDSCAVDDIMLWYTEKELHEDDEAMLQAEREQQQKRVKRNEFIQCERNRLELDRKLMTIEDETSKMLQQLDFSDEEASINEETSSRPPRNALLFGRVKDVILFKSNWVYGSGLQNDDEVEEEKERCEAERLRQLQLDHWEAERIAEDERLEEEKRKQEILHAQKELQKVNRKKDAQSFIQWQDETHKRRKQNMEAAISQETTTRMTYEDLEGQKLRDSLCSEVKNMEYEDSLSEAYSFQCSRIIDKNNRIIHQERLGMHREDCLSQEYQILHDTKKRVDEARKTFLKELYHPFVPYFDPSGNSTKPISRLQAWHHRKVIPKYRYTIPHAEAILESPSIEVLAVQPSRKFQSLLGLHIDRRQDPKTPAARVLKSLAMRDKNRSTPAFTSSRTGSRIEKVLRRNERAERKNQVPSRKPPILVTQTEKPKRTPKKHTFTYRSRVVELPALLPRKDAELI